MRTSVLCFAVFPCAASAFSTTFQRGGFTQESFLQPLIVYFIFFLRMYFLTLWGGGGGKEQIDPSHDVSLAACDQDGLKSGREAA